MEEIINPWKEFENVEGMRDSRESLLSIYKKIKFFPFLPQLSRNKKCNIVVVGASLYFQLSKDIQKASHLILRPRDLLKYKFFSLKIAKNFTLDLKIYKKIYFSLTNDVYDDDFSYPKKVLSSIYPKIIIISSTIDPVQRLWAFWAKKLGIKIICFQHGLYSSLSPLEVLERDIVDFYFSISRKQSEITQKIIPIDKHRFLYSQDNFIYKIPKNKKLKICIIGTDHERYGYKGTQNKKKVLNIYYSLIKLLKEGKLGDYELLYKKHPSEKWTGQLNKFVTIVNNIDSNSVDIFFGIASTMLLKLASEHRCAIQVASKQMKLDNYEEFGFCKTIEIPDEQVHKLEIFSEHKINIPCLKKNNFNKELTKIMNNL